MSQSQPYDLPISVQFDFETGTFSPRHQKTERRVSDLSMMFHDKKAVEEAVAAGDRVVYEILYQGFLTSRSDMALGVTRIFPGKIGDEYHMTKGHFHEAEDQPEIYFCVQGEGYLLLETLDGDFRAERWTPGTITHIPPHYAHRVVNTSDDILVNVATYHLCAGHNYEPIIERGFAKLVRERDGKPVLVPNERHNQ